MRSTIPVTAIALWALLFALTSPEALGQAAERGVTAEQKLWGHWQSLDGKYALQIKDDRTAIVEIAGEKPEDPLVVCFGEIALKRGDWLLTVTDPQRRKLIFGMAFESTRRMTLTKGDAKGEVIDFVKCDSPFAAFDANGDGLLTPAELKKTRIAYYFANCDTSLDKQLDRSEYATYWRKYAK